MDGLEGNVHILGYIIEIFKLFSCMILKVWRLLGTAINSPNIGTGKNSQRLHVVGRLMPSTPTPPLKDVQVPFSRTCKYYILHGKRDFEDVF